MQPTDTHAAAVAVLPSALQAVDAEEQPLESGVAPLLFVFLLPMLAIVGLVLWIGASPTWLLVGVAIATIAVMTGFVMVAINRLLADGGAEH